MSTETGKPVIENPPGDLDVSDLPPELAHVAIAARWAEDSEDARRADCERRDRAIVAADAAGYSYGKIEAALNRGAGHGSVTIIRKAIQKYG